MWHLKKVFFCCCYFCICSQVVAKLVSYSEANPNSNLMIRWAGLKIKYFWAKCEGSHTIIFLSEFTVYEWQICLHTWLVATAVSYDTGDEVADQVCGQDIIPWLMFKALTENQLDMYTSIIPESYFHCLLILDLF